MSGAADLIRIAKAEVGYKEGFSNGHWNNKEKYAAQVPGMAWVSDGGYPWCALFVSWAALKSGNADLFPRTASCATAVNWFRSKGRFSWYPAIGAQVFYGSNGGTHTGIVYAYDSTYIYTVEGNTNTTGSPEGDGVYLRKRARRDANTYGYGLPKFAEGVTTADPTLKGKSGFVYAAKADGPAAKHAAPSTGLKKVIVKSGMTLSSIALAAGVTLTSLLTANPTIKDPNVIHPGQTIAVPAKPAATKKATPKATPKASSKPTPKASATKSTCK
ncbi:LysM peptidoglycan-binding domain-containing protein [Streptomyces sp. SID8381]|uniref:LysM peptidoglycan-binding domain-containing protein n=1 Tax=unclassified Streptomyces TaxID=2593676 RepID=UPI000368208F|nr:MULTISPECIES: LysM peptidoglycan-binding domain-containing protein [unclassified Streptomyces]MYX26062.1 LysM peptidoglycan-binding domain-containing protein [Streptomyces sp. SID8381]